MYEAVYLNQKAKGEEHKVINIIEGIWEYYIMHPEKLPGDYREIQETEGLERAVCDYISGMTDGYAMEIFSKIFIPAAWTVK